MRVENYTRWEKLLKEGSRKLKCSVQWARFFSYWMRNKAVTRMLTWSFKVFNRILRFSCYFYVISIWTKISMIFVKHKSQIFFWWSFHFQCGKKILICIVNLNPTIALYLREKRRIPENTLWIKQKLKLSPHDRKCIVQIVEFLFLSVIPSMQLVPFPSGERLLLRETKSFQWTVFTLSRKQHFQ